MITVYQDALLLEYFNKFSKELFYLKFDIIFWINIKFMFVNNIIPNIPEAVKMYFGRNILQRIYFALYLWYLIVRVSWNSLIYMY